MTTAIVLAGGLGTRLRNTVPDVPKPMAPVRGRPFLAHQMDYWVEQGVTRFVIAVGYKHQQIQDYFRATYKGIPVEYAVEATPLGTGGGLLLAARSFASDELFVVLNGDTFFAVSLHSLISFHMQRQSDWTVAVFRSPDTKRYLGMDIAQDGRILSLTSRRPTNSLGLVNGGVYLLSPTTLGRLDMNPCVNASLEDELLPACLAGGGRIFGSECAGRFIDIGIPEDYKRAGEILP